MEHEGEQLVILGICLFNNIHFFHLSKPCYYSLTLKVLFFQNFLQLENFDIHTAAPVEQKEHLKY